jgi:hypothetical protein
MMFAFYVQERTFPVFFFIFFGSASIPPTMGKFKKLFSAIKDAMGSEKHLLLVGLDGSGKSKPVDFFCTFKFLRTCSTFFVSFFFTFYWKFLNFTEQNKTGTILFRLKYGQTVLTIPTVSPSVETIEIEAIII